MSLFHKTESYLGIDIGSHGIKLVELRKAKGRPQLWTYGIADADLDIHLPEVGVVNAEPENQMNSGAFITTGEQMAAKQKIEQTQKMDADRVDKYAQLLKTVIGEARAEGKHVTASLPVSYVFHTVITLPKMPAKEINFNVLAKVKKMLPRPIEEMQIVHQAIPDKGGNESDKEIKILVTAAPLEAVTFYSSIFKKAGVALEELETEAFALERSLVGRDSATVMVVDIGAERTNFFIIDQSVPLVHRTTKLGGNDFNRIISNTLGISPDECAQVKKDLGHMNKLDLDGVFMPLIDPIIKEIQYSFDLFLHQTGNENKRPEKIILTGGESIFPPIVSTVAKAFPVKVFVGDPWARVVYQQGIKRILDTIGPRMSVAIGLALRNIVP